MIQKLMSFALIGLALLAGPMAWAERLFPEVILINNSNANQVEVLIRNPGGCIQSHAVLIPRGATKDIPATRFFDLQIQSGNPTLGQECAQTRQLVVTASLKIPSPSGQGVGAIFPGDRIKIQGAHSTSATFTYWEDPGISPAVGPDRQNGK